MLTRFLPAPDNLTTKLRALSDTPLLVFSATAAQGRARSREVLEARMAALFPDAGLAAIHDRARVYASVSDRLLVTLHANGTLELDQVERLDHRIFESYRRDLEEFSATWELPPLPILPPICDGD